MVVSIEKKKKRRRTAGRCFPSLTYVKGKYRIECKLMFFISNREEIGVRRDDDQNQTLYMFLEIDICLIMIPVRRVLCNKLNGGGRG